MQVSEFIVKYLEKLDIDTIFGMPGAHILPVYDSLYDSSIHSVLVKHEQGASFMAGGYAKATGKIGACITTAGPGATNLVTGIGNAFADSQAVLAITGEAPTYLFGKGGLQESSGEGLSIDQSTLFQGITVYHKMIERTDYLVNILNQATKLLLADNPGPVVLSLPYNLQKEDIDAKWLDALVVRKKQFNVPIKTQTPNMVFCADQVSDAVELLANARYPVIVAGYGAILSHAQATISELSEMLTIPVTTSLKGKGVIDEQSDLSLGSLGVTSGGKAYKYVKEFADLVIFLGAGFNERTSYVWQQGLLAGKKVIQIDINAQQLEKTFAADIAIQGDIKALCQQLLTHCQTHELPPKKSPPKTDNDLARIFNDKFSLIEHFYLTLQQNVRKNLYFFDDNIIFAQNFLQVNPHNRYFPNSGISSLGHAIPAAIGAGMAKDLPTDKALFALLGDGGFQMCCMEIMTAVNYAVPLNVVVLNNETMGLIRKNQYQQYNERFLDCDFINPDFSYLARSFGVDYVKLDTKDACSAFMQSTDFTRGIRLIEIPLAQDAYPNYSSNR